MSEPAIHPDRVKLAARLYYTDGLSQIEVSNILEVSQAMVSRFLRQARDAGIVRITVEEYEPRDARLERDLRAAFPSLHDAVVLRDPAQASVAGIRRNVGYFGAPSVAAMVRPGQVVGLTGGRTLAELVGRLRPTAGPVRDLRVVPLMGSIGAAVNQSDAAELGRTLADAFGGSCYVLNTPAFVSTAAGRTALLGQEQVRAVLGLHGVMTLALVGVGTLRESAFIDRGILNAADLARLRRAGAVGETCGRYFDADGRECATEFRKRVVSIDLDDLRRMPEVVGVTAGAGRGEAVAVAARAGLVKSLVVDERCARAALDFRPARAATRGKARR